MCVERLQPLLASCSNALDWLRLSLAPQQRSAQDSCTAIVRNRPTSSLRRPCEHWRAAPHLLGDRVGPPCRHAARERLRKQAVRQSQKMSLSAARKRGLEASRSDPAFLVLHDPKAKKRDPDSLWGCVCIHVDDFL